MDHAHSVFDLLKNLMSMKIDIGNLLSKVTCYEKLFHLSIKNNFNIRNKEQLPKH